MRQEAARICMAARMRPELPALPRNRQCSQDLMHLCVDRLIFSTVLVHSTHMHLLWIDHRAHVHDLLVHSLNLMCDKEQPG